MTKHIGLQTINFDNPVTILSTASIVGPKEGEGPLAKYFDKIEQDVLCGTDSWEKAESEFVKQTLQLAVKKANLTTDDIHYVLAGDLLNQSSGSSFGVRSLNIPFFGMFGACSTMGLSMSLGAVLVDGGYADYVLVGASSHFCAAEKQFRFPLELGTQRPLTASWTVTGDGAAVLSSKGEGPYIKAITTGKIIDMGITDINNMGAAMAPAAVDTLVNHFKDLNRDPSYYDVIATGDLGYVGKDLVVKLMREEGYEMGSKYTDCGIEIFDREKQDTHNGGSGCGCSAVTFAGFYFKMLKEKKINRMLFIPTGALMNATTAQQGESIPSIAHCVVIEN